MRSWLPALAAILAFPSASLAQGDVDRLLLEGLGDVSVHLNLPEDVPAAVGLDAENLATVVELGLRRSGIPIHEFSRDWVSVSVSLLPIAEGYAYHLSLHLLGNALLPRRQLSTLIESNPEMPIGEFFRSVGTSLNTNVQYLPATTWREEAFGKSSLNRTWTSVRDDLRELVDDFANDYLAANPR